MSKKTPANKKESSGSKAEYLRNWYAKNKDHVKAYAKGYRATKNELRRLRYQNDSAFREQCKAKANEYRKANPERRRHSNIKKLYGVTPKDYARLLTKQNNACAICLQAFADTPHVDHCHATNRARGLLCSQCNFGIGKFHDSPDRLRRAAEYLENHKPDI